MNQTFARQKLQLLIDHVRPLHKSIKWMDGGDNRFIAVVDDNEVFRFPKEDTVKATSRYEYEALKLLQGRLSVAIPKPIELAADGSYTVLSFLSGKVLGKHAVAKLPQHKRRNLGVAVAGIINQLNSSVTINELSTLPSSRLLARNKDAYYAEIYTAAGQQHSPHSALFRKYYERLQQMRPNGSSSNIIVFGDFSSPNLVLSEADKLIGVIDWTELGKGDIHNELRPVFSVIGQNAFEDMVEALDPKLGPVNHELVRLYAMVHELGVLVHGKQKGTLTPERTELAMDSLRNWLPQHAL